jgi:hypothetical protein
MSLRESNWNHLQYCLAFVIRMKHKHEVIFVRVRRKIENCTDVISCRTQFDVRRKVLEVLILSGLLTCRNTCTFEDGNEIIHERKKKL